MKRDFGAKTDSSLLLLLLRHGIAAPQDVGLSDFERVLTTEGAQECRQVAAKLADRHPGIDLMISSPADRALETAHIFAKSLKYPISAIQISDVMWAYDSIRPFLTLIKTIDSRNKVVALVGHNPTFDLLAHYFIPAFSRSIPKGAAVAIAFREKSWSGIGPHAGKLLFMESPSTRKKSGSGRMGS